MWKTAIVSELEFAANSSVRRGLVMTSWSASSTPELLRSCDPLPPVGYRRTPRALSTPFRYENARISFEFGAAELDSTYTVPVVEGAFGPRPVSAREAGGAGMTPSAAPATIEPMAQKAARPLRSSVIREASGTAEDYRRSRANRRCVPLVTVTVTVADREPLPHLSGRSLEQLAAVNRRGAALVQGIRASGAEDAGILVSGCVGPRGDGYRAEQTRTASEAEDYHAFHIGTFADADVDTVTALALT